MLREEKRGATLEAVISRMKILDNDLHFDHQEEIREKIFDFQ